MTNPFKLGAVDLNDRPMTAEQRTLATQQRGNDGMVGIGGGVGIRGDQIVTFDPTTKSTNHVGHGLVDLLVGELTRRSDEQGKALAELIAELIFPYEKRIAQLDRALDVERTKVASAIRQAAAGFLGDDPAPTMD